MLRVLSAAIFVAATVPALAQDSQAPVPSQQPCESAAASWWSNLFGPGEISLGVKVRAVEVTTPAEPAEEGDAPCVCGDALHAVQNCPCFALFERMVDATEVEDTNEDGTPCRNKLSLGVIPPPFHVLTGDATGIPVRIGLHMAPDELPHAPQSAACAEHADCTARSDCAAHAVCTVKAGTAHVGCCEGDDCPETCCEGECASSGCCALTCRAAVCGSAAYGNAVCGTTACQQGCPVVCGVPNANCPQTHNLQQTRNFVVALTTARPKCGAASCKCVDCKCSGTECAGPTTGARCVVTYTHASGACDSSGTLVSVSDKWIMVREDSQQECWIPADRVLAIRTQPASGAQRFTWRLAPPQQPPQAVTPQIARRMPQQILFAAPHTGAWQTLPSPHETVIQIPLPPQTAPAPPTAAPATPPSTSGYYPAVPPAPPLMPTTPSERPISPPAYTPAVPAIPPPAYAPAAPPVPAPAPPAVYPATSYRAGRESIESLTCADSPCAMAAPHVCTSGSYAECQATTAAHGHATSQYCITISRFDGDKMLQESQLVTSSGQAAWMNVANFGIGVRVDSPLEEGGPLRLAAYDQQGGRKPLAVADVRLGDGLKLKWPTPHSKVAETVQIDVNALSYAPAHAAVYSHPVMPQPVPSQPAPTRPGSTQATPIIGRLFGIRAEAVPANPLEVRVYAVAEFIATPPSGSPIAVVGGVARHTPSFQPLVELIKTQIEPSSWREGGAVIHPFPQNYSLVIRQSEKGHEQIASLFEQLRKLKYGEARTARTLEEWTPEPRTQEKLPPAAEAESEE